ncbi:chaperone protein [Grosmannia clavigera kw1407]|uniref:Chaperone protein n=1 Tax=Grosmannia clavigera (strain kw1407 / UAMH 11150) TaxID=655863 RepID=F0XG37_GROCL|nr:chaperone protein [Grosmannia clavigera kw1407]EFX03401.1 chaperone protein [Grosmannia clavigera kw1407]
MDGLSADEDFYAILEIATTADSSAISASYRRLARLRHPDKSPGNPQATAAFQKLHEAYSVLIDAKSRADYDYNHLRPSCRTKSPKNKKRFRYKFYSFNISEKWERRSSSNHDGPSSPPPMVDLLAHGIQNIRRQVNEDDTTLVREKAIAKDLVARIDGVWRQIHGTEESLKQMDDEILFLSNKNKLLGSGYCKLDDLATTGSGSWAEGRKVVLLEKRQCLQSVMVQLRQQLETFAALLRAHITKSKELISNKLEKEEKLHALCKAWRAREFHGGEESAESDSWGGWDGWCCWDRHETDTSCEEDKREEQKKWWEEEEVEGCSSWESWESPDISAAGDDCTNGAETTEPDLIDLQEMNHENSAGFQVESNQFGSMEDEEDSVSSAGPIWTDEFDVDLVKRDGNNSVPKEGGSRHALENAWWPEADKDRETARGWEIYEDERRQASWQEW